MTPRSGHREGPRIEVRVAPGSFGDAPAELLEAAVRAVLDAEGVSEADVSLALLDDREIRALNLAHLGQDRVTDVLAFALWEEGEPVVGDVYVAHNQALRQAAAEGVSPDEELVRLAVHGTLHVLGWDHPEGADERDASDMFRRQEKLVGRLTGD